MSQYVRIADRVACWELFIEEIASEMVVASELGLDDKAILKNISNISPTNLASERIFPRNLFCYLLILYKCSLTIFYTGLDYRNIINIDFTCEINRCAFLCLEQICLYIIAS